MKRSGCLLCVLAFCGLRAPAQANAVHHPVFSIGTMDRSSAEFSGGTPSTPVRFLAAPGTPAAEWYATQPAAYDGAGHASTIASAPRAIVFSLANAPEKTYRLRVSLLVESASVPALQVSINGKLGRFYPQPRLDLNMGDEVAAFDPEYSHADVTFDFPGSYLRQGSNTITLQAIEEAAQAVPDASLTYDAIELDSAAGATPSAFASPLVVPTVFYRKSNGRLTEDVDAFVPVDGPVQAGNVQLTLNGNTYRQPLVNSRDFGQAKVEFAVAEFTSASPVQLDWPQNGQTLHAAFSILPEKKWTLYLVPHVHLDVGFTDYQAKVAAIQSRILDEAIDLTSRQPDFRFSMDGEWNLAQFWKTRTAAEQQRLVTAIQKRQLFVPAQYANLLTGFPTAETLIRSLYPSADFSRKYGTPFNYANITDVPSYSWSYASILAAAGIHFFLAGSNNDRAPVLLQGHLNQNSPMYWQGPDGGKVLFWYSRHYMQMQFLFGLPPLVAAGHDTLPLFLQMYQHPGYSAHAAILFGSQVENTDLYPQQAKLVPEWNRTYAYPRLEYSGFHHALQTIAQQFGDAIPTIRGDGGPYWEDGIASDAYYAAMERENESRGPSAEKLATLTSVVNPRLAADTSDLDRMWTDMVLMDEHTWTSWNSISDPTSSEAVKQLAVKDARATEARRLASFVRKNSMASLADSISGGPGSLIVFNPLNWTRSGLVSLDLNNEDEIVDLATGHAAPLQIVRLGRNFRRVRFTAENVPGVGYKVFRIQHAAHPQPAARPDELHTTLESPYYRVELDPESGAIRSIYDKQVGRELVNPHSPYRLGQYLYVTGGDRQPNSLMQYRTASRQPELQIHPARQGKLVSVERTPYGSVARMESSDTNTPSIVSEIRLFDREKKIEILADIDKRAVTTNEAVYFAFPFAIDQPEFLYEIQNGVVDPAQDMYPGAGHEWFSVQHWVAVHNATVSATVMPLDAALVTLGDINRGAWPTHFGNRPANIFSYAMNNYWHTNYRAAQGGHFRFRYVVTSAPSTDATALSRLGWEEMTPLEKDQISSQDKALHAQAPWSGTQASFLQIPDPALLLEDWKPAQDGHGTILRLLDLGGEARKVDVQIPSLELQDVSLTDAVERGRQPVVLNGPHQFQLAIRPHQILTVRLIGKDRAASPPDVSPAK